MWSPTHFVYSSMGLTKVERSEAKYDRQVQFVSQMDHILLKALYVLHLLYYGKLLEEGTERVPIMMMPSSHRCCVACMKVIVCLLKVLSLGRYLFLKVLLPGRLNHCIHQVFLSLYDHVFLAGPSPFPCNKLGHTLPFQLSHLVIIKIFL